MIVIESSPEKQEARIIYKDGSKETRIVNVFDNLDIEIRAEVEEFRRTVQLVLLVWLIQL